eukprot:5130468-Prymnesium_polylepis.1
MHVHLGRLLEGGHQSLYSCPALVPPNSDPSAFELDGLLLLPPHLHSAGTQGVGAQALLDRVPMHAWRELVRICRMSSNGSSSSRLLPPPSPPACSCSSRINALQLALVRGATRRGVHKSAREVEILSGPLLPIVERPGTRHGPLPGLRNGCRAGAAEHSHRYDGRKCACESHSLLAPMCRFRISVGLACTSLSHVASHFHCAQVSRALVPLARLPWAQRSARYREKASRSTRFRLRRSS